MGRRVHNQKDKWQTSKCPHTCRALPSLRASGNESRPLTNSLLLSTTKRHIKIFDNERIKRSMPTVILGAKLVILKLPNSSVQDFIMYHPYSKISYCCLAFKVGIQISIVLSIKWRLYNQQME